MAKRIKDKWLGARVDDALITSVEEYLHLAELNMAELVRAAVREYMASHPAKKPREPINLKPGGE